MKIFQCDKHPGQCGCAWLGYCCCCLFFVVSFWAPNLVFNIIFNNELIVIYSYLHGKKEFRVRLYGKDSFKDCFINICSSNIML